MKQSQNKSKNEIDVSKLQQQAVIQQKDNDAIPKEIVVQNLPLVESIAHSIYAKGTIPACIDLEDLISWGLEGLIKAYKNFDAEKGSKFNTYAYYRIRGEIYDFIRREWQYRSPHDYNEYRRQIQEKIADVTEDALNDPKAFDQINLESAISNIISNSSFVYLISLDSMSELEPTSTTYPESHSNGKDELIKEEIEKLDKDEKHLITLFYYQDYTQKEIAKKLQWSRSKVCRTHMDVINKLRTRITRRLKEDA